MKWFRRALSPHQVALSMIGAKAAGRVLMIGAGDGTLAAEVARVTGLNGRTVVADSSADAQARAESAAAAAGSLIEFAPVDGDALPKDDGGFDVVIWNHALHRLPREARQRWAAEASRLLRPGGRVISIDGGPRKGLFFGTAAPREPNVPFSDVLSLLGAAGFRAVRLLAESDAGTFIEGVRPRDSSGPSGASAQAG